MAKLAERWLAGEAGLGAMLGTAPRTPFNAAISPYRAWAACSLPLREMKALARARKTSLNDVLMAVCGGGLRSYLLRKNALPDKPLRAGVPVSLRKPGDASMRNQVTMLFATLATDLTDPLARLAAIKASVDVGKAVVDDTAGLDMSDLHIPGLGALGFGASRLMESLRVANFVDPFVNVVISNVRGPSHTMYLHGAKMCSHFPVSIPAHGVAMNVTVQSYGDRLDLGVTACLEAVPDIADLRDDLSAAWRELYATWRAASPPDEAQSRAA
jgi:WS/DGAT/MGAT family acyltransferase